ncbi:MAG TPA: O-acetyl-ADP-ribose deacetylase [Bacillota bacterium]|nr:O-acetyl-ADP-ribose deacetylase [Bacillota bacterium]HOG53710.1 O-acetyl-ADP-ribose deacetylase [Bacillota bacterium]
MKISIVLGDITKVRADAIVNAANSTLMGGGGVDGAIHRAAGPGLLEECKEIRRTLYPDGLPTGKAVKTDGYRLPCRIIIHTVGPKCPTEGIGLLEDCYRNSLDMAEQEGCSTVAFPAISTGAYGCPIGESARIVKRVLTGYEADRIKEAVLVLFSVPDYEAYKEEFGLA